MQGIALAITHQDGKQMIGVLLIRQEIRKRYQRVVEVLIIIMGHLLTMLVISHQILQLYIQNGCLDLIQTTVTTCVLEDIFLLRTVVGQGTDGLSKLSIIGSDCTSITQSTKVLAGIEAVTGSIADRASHPTIGVLAAMGLCIVFNQLEVVLLT